MTITHKKFKALNRKQHTNQAAQAFAGNQAALNRSVQPSPLNRQTAQRTGHGRKA
jgi:hypothetical protein